MHLGFEGGVAERRTTPSSTGLGLDAGLVHTHVAGKENTAALASVAVELEESAEDVQGRAPGTARKVSKTTKKVAFHTEMPDVYDF